MLVSERVYPPKQKKHPTKTNYRMLHLPPSWCSDLDQISSIFWVPTAFHQLTWAQETEFKKQISPYVGMQNSTPRMTNDITYHPKTAFSAHFLAFSLAFFPSPMLRHLFWSQRKLDTNSTPKPKTGWWFQPIWKKCSSNWIISPNFGGKIKNI